MRKTVLLAAALAGSALLLRRSKRFGPLSAMALATLLEQVVPVLRQPAASKAAKPSLWARLTTRKPPAPAE